MEVKENIFFMFVNDSEVELKNITDCFKLANTNSYTFYC